MGFARTLGIFLGFCAVFLSFYCLTTPFWARNVSNMSGIQTSTTKALGLWKYCEKPQNGGNYQCQSLSQFGIAQLAQYGIVGFRALVILGCIAGTCGLISGIASSESVNIASSKKDKNRAAGGAAGCFSVAGFLILAATSWAAHSIIRRYKMLTMGGSGYGGGMQVNAGTQWTLGAAIYAGWCASAIFIGVAIIMFMGCCSNSDDEEEEYDVDYAQRNNYQAGYAQSYHSSQYSQRKEFV
ncbi:unnamed protein product [Oikopleura dioica]|uniref:Claudin n=1 Tax=Oikopleura dioica TaxID=34765 RepID=E4XPP0_OIKDI|nr:unnamed protein product [Oikopleura dioica]